MTPRWRVIKSCLHNLQEWRIKTGCDVQGLGQLPGAWLTVHSPAKQITWGMVCCPFTNQWYLKHAKQSCGRLTREPNIHCEQHNRSHSDVCPSRGRGPPCNRHLMRPPLLRRHVILTSLGERQCTQPMARQEHYAHVWLGPGIVELKTSPFGRYSIRKTLSLETNTTGRALRHFIRGKEG